MKPRKPTERSSMQGGRDAKHSKDTARHSSPILGSLHIRSRDPTSRRTEDYGRSESSTKANTNRISNSSDVSVPDSNMHTDSGISSYDSLSGGDKTDSSSTEHDFVAELLKMADRKFSDMNARESWVDEDKIVEDMKQVVIKPAEQTKAVMPVLGNTTVDMATSTTSIFMTAMDTDVDVPNFNGYSTYENRSSLPFSEDNHVDIQDDNNLFCKSCYNIYNTPRLLPCLHTFCTNCLQSRVRNKDAVTTVTPEFSNVSCDESVLSCETLTCPTCFATVELSLEGVYGLPLNHSIQRLLLLHNLKSGRTNQITCDLCPDSSKMEARCIQCNVNMCQFCFQAHKRQSLTAAHCVISTRELSDEGFRSNLPDSPVRKVHIPVMCQRHTNEELKLYCTDCSQLVCRDCCLGPKHKDHKCEYLNHVIERKTGDLSREYELCKSKILTLQEAAVALDQSRKSVEETVEEVTGKIEQHFDSYINTLQKHKLSLLAAVEAKAKSRNESIQTQKNTNKKLLDDILHSCEFTSDLLRSGSNHEILSLKPYVLSRLKKLSQTPFTQTPSPSENFIEFVPNKKVKAWIDGDMASELGKAKRSSRLLRPGVEVDICGDVVSHAIEIGNCTANGDGIQYSHVRLPSEFIITVKNFEGKRLNTGGHSVTAFITMDGVDSLLYRKPKVQITDRKDGTYRVLYIVYATGTYSLDVRISDKPIRGSPFTISAIDSKNNVHSGIFHCCSFCSSGGDQNSPCACGAAMQGCRHGHDGHPGVAHWSCCGKTTESAPCGRSTLHQQGLNSTVNHNHTSSTYSLPRQCNTLPARRNQSRDYVSQLGPGDALYARQTVLRTQRGLSSPAQYRNKTYPISPLAKQVKTVTL